MNFEVFRVYLPRPAIATRANNMVMMDFLFIFVNVFTFLLYIRRNCGNMTLRGVKLS